MSETFIALMEAGSIETSFFAFSSMAMVRPMTNGDGATVMLKAAMCLCMAALRPSESSL